VFGFEWLARKSGGQQVAIRIRDEVTTTPATPHAKAEREAERSLPEKG